MKLWMDGVETEGYPARSEALSKQLQNGAETCCEKRDEQFCRVLRRIAEGEFGEAPLELGDDASGEKAAKGGGLFQRRFRCQFAGIEE